MNNYIEQRTKQLGQYIVDNHCTVRQVAKIFYLSKSTVHKDVTTRLKQIDNNLYQQVNKILQTNWKERHIRGGQATKQKYLG
ncbi:MAG: sporulation transcriptional regulator SpoIIID [Clostridia bacterium]|nr:sporulation transcriptional regulator SpoIIID [Clostridia bacterium]